MMETARAGGGGKPGVPAGLQEVKGAQDIGMDKIVRAGDRAVHVRFGGQVEHVRDGVFLDDLKDGGFVPQEKVHVSSFSNK
jgi:hypothetical protein